MDVRPSSSLRLLGTGLVLLLGLTLASCSTTPPTRSGADEDERTLIAATYFATGYPSGDTLARMVETLDAQGSVTLRVEDDMLANTNRDPGSAVLALVRAGDLDLGVVPTRVFDLVGVTSFQGLQAPMRFVSVEQTDALLTDPIAERMMGPLESLGLVPLALTWDALRNVKGYAGGLTRPEDFAGQQIAARPSDATRMALTTLGAQMYPEVGRPFEEAVAAGEVAGLEDSINQSNLEAAGTSVANEFLSFKANVVVVNADTWRTLTTGQQDRLREAATDARDFSMTDMAYHLDLATAARQYCEEGHGDVVVASDEDVAAMQAAVEPVIEALRADPLTNDVIDRVGELGRQHPSATPVTPCRAARAPSVGYAPVEAVGDQTVLDGTWRLEVSRETLLAAGVNPTDASNNAAIWTWTVGRGHVVPIKEGQAPCDSEYRINGDLFSIIFDETTGCSDDFTAHWRREGNRLYLSDMTAPAEYIVLFYEAFFHDPLTRIGSE